MKKNLYLFSLLLACAYLQPVYAQPDSSCTAAFYFTKSGNTVNFFSFPTLPPGTTHWWTFGDATNSSAVNPVHNYAAPGTYWVTHYIQNDSTNCRDSVVRSVTIDSTNCTIQAKFSIFRDSINCRRIYFINQSAPVSPNVTFTWRFGDGTTSNEANPVHIYPRDSVYFACLIVDAGNNCRREYCMRIEIRCDTPCNLQPDFTWRRDSIQTSKVYFINQMQATSPNTSYLWTFGDGTSSTERNPVHVYQQPGKYKVCLIAQSSPTCRREICKEVIVEKDQCNVRAKFQWKRDPIQSNKIWFANHSQPVPNIWRTAWSYGDGTFSQDFNSVHVYQRPGKYMVCLQVQSLSGCTSVYCDSVIVQPSCDSTGLRFEYRRDTLQPYRVSFRSVSNTPLTQQQWVITRLNTQFPTPVVLNGPNPVYSFPDSGFYRVCLTAVTANNCKKVYCENIFIPQGGNGRANITSNIPVYPNPATNAVRLEVKMDGANMIRFRVMDGSGVQKMEFTRQGQHGLNYIQIPVERLGSGQYLVEIRYGNQLKLAKFQKS